MQGKVCLVTGANSGIGRETCFGLARQGAEVIMSARKREKAEEVREEIISKTGNSQVHLIVADLSSMQEIVTLTDELQSRFQRLDLLINNAGTFLSRYVETTDGFEMQWAVNYLAPYVLTRRLLGILTSSGASRIINVSSNGHFRGNIDFEDLNGKKKYDGLRAYSQSKLGNILFTKELAARLSDSLVTTNALHPGVVRTGIGNKNNSSWISWVWNLWKPFMLSAENGAATSLFLATSPAVADVSGKYFVKSKQQSSSAMSNDPALAHRLWQVSEQMTKKYL